MDLTSYVIGKKAGGGTPTILEEKDVTVTTNGESEITPSTGYNGIRKVNLTTSVQPNLESKSITIDTNTTTTITPTQGKDGLSSVEVTTAIPQPSGTISITQNGTGIDVSSYASADVSVPSNEPYSPRTIKIWADIYNPCPYTDIVSETSNFDASNLLNLYATFQNLSKVTLINLTNWRNLNLGNTANAFLGCSKVTTILMPNLSVTSSGAINNMFANCSQLSKIDARSFMFSTAGVSNSMLQNVPTSCLIIVKDNTEKQWFATNFSSYTNIKTPSEL